MIALNTFRCIYDVRFQVCHISWYIFTSSPQLRSSVEENVVHSQIMFNGRHIIEDDANAPYKIVAAEKMHAVQATDELAVCQRGNCKLSSVYARGTIVNYGFVAFLF